MFVDRMETPAQTRKVVSHRKKTLKRSIHKLYPTNTITDETIESIPVLFEIFNTYAPLSKISLPYRNFYHIGSGLGKVVISMAKEHSFLKAVGIESNSEKVILANTVLNKIREEGLRKRIEIYCISSSDSSLNYANACWILLSEEDHNSVIEKLVSEVKSGCIVLSFKEIYNSQFNKINYVSLPTSTSADSKVYVYRTV